jgi:ribose 5-phosphate isomerase A
MARMRSTLPQSDQGDGRALLREKIVAFASKQEVIIIDDSKLVDVLGPSPHCRSRSCLLTHQDRDALEGLGCKVALKGGNAILDGQWHLIMNASSSG